MKIQEFIAEVGAFADKYPEAEVRVASDNGDGPIAPVEGIGIESAFLTIYYREEED